MVWSLSEGEATPAMAAASCLGDLWIYHTISAEEQRRGRAILPPGGCFVKVPSLFLSKPAGGGGGWGGEKNTQNS